MIRILMCGPIAKSGGVSTHTKCLSEHLSKIGTEIIPFNLSGKTIMSLNATAARKLYQRTLGLLLVAYTKRFNYNIIHIQISGGIFSFITGFFGVLASKITNKPLIVTFHYRPSREFILKYRILFNLVLRCCAAFLVVSKIQKEIIVQIFPEFSDKIVVITNGFASEKFCMADKDSSRITLGLPIDKKILLSIGNLVTEKGHKYLLSSIKLLSYARSDILCIIIGSGSLRAELEQQCKVLELEKFVKFIGEKSHDEIPLWISAADLFVLPSVIEANPTVMFEALGCGRPFIGSKIGGIPEVISSGNYGLLCEPSNSDDLARALIEGLNKSWDYEKIKEYSQNFTWERVASDIFKVYMDIV